MSGYPYAYADRLASFILDHIDRPYSADEVGDILDVRIHRDERALADALAAALDSAAYSFTALAKRPDIAAVLARYREARR